MVFILSYELKIDRMSQLYPKLPSRENSVKTLLRYTLFLLFLFLVIGCKSNEQNAQIGDTEIKEVTIAPTSVQKTPFVFSTSEPGTVTIHSQLLVIDPMIIAPDPKTPDPIFLVPLPDQNTSVMTIPSFEIGKVPQAEVNEATGEFVFTNIKPGRYIVMVLLISGQQVPASYYDTRNIAVVTIDSNGIDQMIELNALSVP